MTDAAGSPFGVETIVLDLPALTGAFCRRLREAGLPITPARAAELARALTLTRPVSRRRLYWTARAVLVSDPTQVRVFDALFREVFGTSARPSVDLEEAPTEVAPLDDRPAPGRASRTGDDATPGVRDLIQAAPAGREGDEREVEVPVAMAIDEEVLAQKRFDGLAPDELARLDALMTRLRLATPERRTRRFERGHRHGQVDLRRTLRGSLRTGGDPIRLARRQRRIVPRRLVLLCDISGSMEPYARAYLQFLTCAAGSRSRSPAGSGATSRAGSCCCATSRARWSPTRARTCSSSSRPRAAVAASRRSCSPRG